MPIENCSKEKGFKPFRFGQNATGVKLGEEISQKMAEELDLLRRQHSPKKISFEELGELLDIENANAYRILTGKHSLPMKQFIEVSMILGVSPVRMFEIFWMRNIN